MMSRDLWHCIGTFWEYTNRRSFLRRPFDVSRTSGLGWCVPQGCFHAQASPDPPRDTANVAPASQAQLVKGVARWKHHFFAILSSVVGEAWFFCTACLHASVEAVVGRISKDTFAA